MSAIKHDVHVHFDGKVIVPDEPFTFPVNQPFKIRVISETQRPIVSVSDSDEDEEDLTPEEQRAALRELVSMMGSLPEVSLESTRRVNMYEDERF